mmetsp:Transcript_27084/g.44167  ORF Transcript_27084/g.44167 Transcript_27084/m.44167 type:complete len:201 (-) Transcript_27084:4-606(-)
MPRPSCSTLSCSSSILSEGCKLLEVAEGCKLFSSRIWFRPSCIRACMVGTGNRVRKRELGIALFVVVAALPLQLPSFCFPVGPGPVPDDAFTPPLPAPAPRPFKSCSWAWTWVWAWWMIRRRCSFLRSARSRHRIRICMRSGTFSSVKVARECSFFFFLGESFFFLSSFFLSPALKLVSSSTRSHCNCKPRRRMGWETYT